MQLKLNKYKLTYDEAYSAFYEMSCRFGKRIQNIVAGLTVCCVLLMLYLQYSNPDALFYTVTALFGIIVLYLLVYKPHLKSRKAASAVMKMGAEFDISVCDDGTVECQTDRGPIKFNLNDNKNSRAVETDKLYTVRSDSSFMLCIPKRVLKKEEKAFIEETLRKTANKYLCRTEKEEKH